MNKADIENLVIVKLEEYSPFAPTEDKNAPLLGGNDVLSEVKPIYSYVSNSIATAGNEILRVAPINKLTPKKYYAGCDEDEERPHTGSFKLPSNFLRLHTLKMDGWKRPIHEVYYDGHPLYNSQFFDTTCGNEYKPVATISHNRLNYYSIPCGYDHDIEIMLYIQDYNSTLEFSDDIGEVIALNCAKKVYEIFGNVEQVNIMMSEIKSKLENLAI